MNEKYLPTTRLGKLERLIEEASEVILAAQKLKRFGHGEYVIEGVHYDNIGALQNEMADLDDAMSRVRCIDLTKLHDEEEPSLAQVHGFDPANEERERGDDDGVEYADPRDYKKGLE